METIQQCQYCKWIWKEKLSFSGETPLVTVCKKCLFKENQTRESIMETRRQISLLFPNCRGRSGYCGEVKLYVEGGTADQEPVEASVLLLAFESPVLNDMITSMSDYKLIIKHASAPLLRAVVKFLCTGEISYTTEVEVTHVNVLKFTHEYMIGKLKNNCVAELTKQVKDENLCSVLKLSQECSAGDLEKAGLEYFERKRKLLKTGIVEGVHKIAHEYQLKKLEKISEIELLDRVLSPDYRYSSS